MADAKHVRLAKRRTAATVMDAMAQFVTATTAEIVTDAKLATVIQAIHARTATLAAMMGRQISHALTATTAATQGNRAA